MGVRACDCRVIVAMNPRPHQSAHRSLPPMGGPTPWRRTTSSLVIKTKTNCLARTTECSSPTALKTCTCSTLSLRTGSYSFEDGPTWSKSEFLSRVYTYGRLTVLRVSYSSCFDTHILPTDNGGAGALLYISCVYALVIIISGLTLRTNIITHYYTTF